MTDISLLHFFGATNDFENLKKWLKINSELYRDLIVAAKERSDLENEYSSRLMKINAKILKSFSQSLGSMSSLWTKTTQLMNEESDAHKNLGSQICEDFYKPLINVADQFNRLKKPIEIKIDKYIKLLQDKRDEEFRLKKKAIVATKDSEKAYECISEYKASHPSSVSGIDKDRTKIEKRAAQLRDCSTKAESEYFESSITSEESRYKLEQAYILGLEQLQKLETDRLNSMKTIIESYHKCIDKIPLAYTNIANTLLKEINIANVKDDLFENSMYFTNKTPNVYKSEQLMLDFYSESKENPMNLNRRKENLMKRISVLYQHQKKSDNFRTGALKMLTVYEDSPQFADEETRKKTKQEYSKTQSLVNLLSANIYKIQVALNSFVGKPEPPNPLTGLGMKIIETKDRNHLLQSVLESKPGTMLPSFEPGISSNVSSNRGSISEKYCPDDDDEEFDTDPETEPSPPVRPYMSQLSNNYFPPTKPILQVNPNRIKTALRPLPPLPSDTQCKALHSFIGRDKEELSFKEGDIIKVTRKIDDVWWQGELRGKVGLIPVNYVTDLC